MGKRAPMVLSKMVISRLKAFSALAITNGARLMDSVPPETISSPSPTVTMRAASSVAARPLPHRRLTVIPATDSGSPANKPA